MKRLLLACTLVFAASVVIPAAPPSATTPIGTVPGSFWSGSAWAVEPGERLPDPAMERRARGITAELRCLVCQNESVDDSGADLAHDIRVLVRDRLRAGDNDVEARQAVVDRYGQFVLLRPLVEPATYVLWFGPVALLFLGFAGTALWLRRRPSATAGPAAPLTEAEQGRLDAMLRDRDV